jgi:CBS domain-containing protein/sporulation protein YlmC with PRC-barrel domain
MSGGPSRVFIARLIGVEVFDPNGDPVGRLRDIVVALRDSGQPPRVLGLVVEVPGKRRIFMPMGRVTDLDARQIVTNGVVNLRRFSQRPTEQLVAGQLLGTAATLRDGSTGTIVDLAMDRTRRLDWDLSKAHLRRAGRGPLRRGETTTVAISEVVGLSLDGAPVDAERMLASYDGLRAADLAGEMHRMPADRRAALAAVLDDERLADVLEELPEDDQVAILGGLSEDRAADVLEAMAPDDAADLLGELEPEAAARFLSLMEPDDADDVRRLLSYDDATAGGMMTSEPVVLTPDATVAEALARVRSAELSPALASQVYVCRAPTETPTGRYLGAVHFQRLLREPPATLVSGVVDPDLEPMAPQAPLTRVTRYFATYNLVAVPIVDDNGRLLGAVTVDDLIDHMLPEDWRGDSPADTDAGTDTETTTD